MQLYQILSRSEISKIFTGRAVPVKVVDDAASITGTLNEAAAMAKSAVSSALGSIQSIVPGSTVLARVLQPPSKSDATPTSKSPGFEIANFFPNKAPSIGKVVEHASVTLRETSQLKSPRLSIVCKSDNTSPTACTSSISSDRLFSKTPSVKEVSTPSSWPGSSKLKESKPATVIMYNDKPIAVVRGPSTPIMPPLQPPAPQFPPYKSNVTIQIPNTVTGTKNTKSTQQPGTTTTATASATMTISEKQTSLLDLRPNSLVTLKKIPGTENFVVQQRVLNTPSVSNQNIPVGKVLPRRVSQPQPTQESTHLNRLNTTKVYNYDPNVKAPQEQAPVMVINREPDKPAEITKMITTTSWTSVLKGASPTQSVAASGQANDTASNSSSAINVSSGSSQLRRVTTNGLTKCDDVPASTDITSPDVPVISLSGGPIPMKITALFDHEGLEMCASREDRVSDDKTDSETNVGDDNTACGVVTFTPVCAPCEVSPDSPDENQLTDTQNEKNEEDRSEPTLPVAKADEIERPQMLQNVVARVYLAPDADENDTETDNDTTPSLKIDSVYSLKEDDIRKYFPNSHSVSTDAESAADSTNALSSTSEDATVASFQIKQEPPDSPSGVDSPAATDNDENIVAGIKQEPEDDLPEVKDEPTDDYNYSNYPISDDEDGEEKEATNIASTSTPKIKEEPDDSALATISQGASQLQADVNKPSKASLHVSKSSTLIRPKPSSLTEGAQLVVGNQRLSIAGGEGIVTDVKGKKFLVLSAPGHSIRGGGVQSTAQQTNTVPVGKTPPATVGLNSLSRGKNYLVTMSNGQKRLVHLPEGTPASSLLTTLSKGKIVQLPANPISVPLAGNKTSQKEVPRKTIVVGGSIDVSNPGSRVINEVRFDKSTGYIDRDTLTKTGQTVIKTITNMAKGPVYKQAVILTPSSSRKQTTVYADTTPPTFGPATKLMRTIISHAKQGEIPPSLDKWGGQNAASAEPKTKVELKANAELKTKADLKSNVERKTNAKLETNAEHKPISEHLRRSTRDRKHKRRYSPPPIGPLKRQKEYNYSTIVVNQWEMSKAKPATKEPSSDSESTESANSDDNNNDTEKSTPTAPKIKMVVKHVKSTKKRQYAITSTTLSDEAPKLKRCSPESVCRDSSDRSSTSGDAEDPAPLKPAVTSREDRMRLLKDLIKEKEAALQLMRKRRQEDVEARKNDPDLMDDDEDDL